MNFQNNRAARLCCGLSFLFCCSLFFPGAEVSAQSVLTLKGRRVDPIRATSGKPTVLIFVRTDCPISNRYAPVLHELAHSYVGHARFWLVYPDKQTTPAEIRSHLRDYEFFIYPLRDPDHVLVKRANVTTTPEAAVFDSQGKLLYHGRIDNLYVEAGRSRPAATTHELKDAIEFAVSGKTPIPDSAPAVGCYISDTK